MRKDRHCRSRGDRQIKSQRKEAAPENSGQKRTTLAPLSNEKDCKTEDGRNQRHCAAGGTLNILDFRPWRVPKIKGLAQGAGKIPTQP